ncbi:MAG: N-acetylneuraminate synthase family protein [Bdellovibrionales bacterium]
MASKKVVKIGDKLVGGDNPCYLVGEIGINHNGDLEIAKKLIDYCAVFDFDCAKFQKRTPELCVPEAQKNLVRKTPWGEMTYLEYRYRVEFNGGQYQQIADHCAKKNIHFSASAWDIPSLEFLMQFNIPFIKVPSALITNKELLKAVGRTGKPIVISSGMSTVPEIDEAVNTCLSVTENVILLHCHSAYPAPLEELNLRVIPTYIERYPECVIGYSGHEFGLDTTMVSAVLGARFLERHITVDRTMWGTDQMSSVEPQGMYKLAKDVRLISKALGDGQKRLYDSELPARNKLRGK